MWEDPIVADVRRIRDDLSAKFDFDVAKIFHDLRQRQASLGDRLVRVSDEQTVEVGAKAEQDATHA